MVPRLALETAFAVFRVGNACPELEGSLPSLQHVNAPKAKGARCK